jgi:hypothetical protein
MNGTKNQIKIERVRPYLQLESEFLVNMLNISGLIISDPEAPLDLKEITLETIKELEIEFASRN